MIILWTKDLPDSKYFGKISRFVECESGAKEAKISQGFGSEQLFAKVGKAGGGTGLEVGDP